MLLLGVQFRWNKALKKTVRRTSSMEQSSFTVEETGHCGNVKKRSETRRRSSPCLVVKVWCMSTDRLWHKPLVIVNLLMPWGIDVRWWKVDAVLKDAGLDGGQFSSDAKKSRWRVNQKDGYMGSSSRCTRCTWDSTPKICVAEKIASAPICMTLRL